MGFLDKAKEKTTQLAGQAKEKLDDAKEKKKIDDLLDDLGRILYRQRTERGEADDEAEITRLVGELQKLEAGGAEVVKKAAEPEATPEATPEAPAAENPAQPPA
jgi:TolA-binding protein